MLDFIVIGAQRSGTTSLWEILRSHPRVCMPADKESAYFGREHKYPGGLEEFVHVHFRTANPDSVLGTATPRYMQGTPGVGVEATAERIHAALPSVRLIAILREPVARAMSAHRYNVMLGKDRRSFAEAIDELLRPDAIERARSQPDGLNGYVVLGEYGRILRRYVDLFDEQLLVVFTEDFERDPAAVVGRVFRHLGLDPLEATADLTVRHHRGGSALRLDPVAQSELRTYLEEHAWSLLPPGAGDAERRGFEFWLRLWNIVADDVVPAVPPEVRAALEAYYRADGEALVTLLRQGLPWGGDNAVSRSADS